MDIGGLPNWLVVAGGLVCLLVVVAIAVGVVLLLTGAKDDREHERDE